MRWSWWIRIYWELTPLVITTVLQQYVTDTKTDMTINGKWRSFEEKMHTTTVSQFTTKMAPGREGKRFFGYKNVKEYRLLTSQHARKPILIILYLSVKGNTELFLIGRYSTHDCEKQTGTCSPAKIFLEFSSSPSAYNFYGFSYVVVFFLALAMERLTRCVWTHCNTVLDTG